MKILHFADVHARDKDIEEITKCLDFMVDTARVERPDIIIDAGDTVDSSLIKADSQSTKLIFRVFQELAEIAPVAIIIGTKSHDGLVAETLQYIKAKYEVCVSIQPEQLYYADGHLSDGVGGASHVEAVISMVPAPSKEFYKTQGGIHASDMEISQAMSMMFAGFATQAAAYDCPHILVGHWQVDGAMISKTQTLVGVDISLSRDQMATANTDLICLGHIHKAQQLGNAIFYSGSITGLTWGELDDKGFYIHEFEDQQYFNQIESRFIKTPSKKLLKIVEDLTQDPKAVDEIDTLLNKYTAYNVENAYLRIEFKVFQDEADKVDSEKIKNFFLSGGAKHVNVDLIRIPRENVRSQTLLQLKSLREKLIEQAKLRGETVPESILSKADLLETTDSNQTIKQVLTQGR